MEEKTYIAIDLKSFYASAECVARGLDPLTTHLVVADRSRTDKTICLAVTPSLKAYGISGRARLFEVVQKTAEINAQRRQRAPGREFLGFSAQEPVLRANPALALDYIVAKPRMAYYIRVSTRVYSIYLRYVAPWDIHVYSIDEVFMDVTPYLKATGLDAVGFARRLTQAVLAETGITATVGIGTNLYLAKIAMDIEAKHMPPDGYGARIACLDEKTYRQRLWEHTPLTDFWRIGPGIAKKLISYGMYTMGDVARASVGGAGSWHNEALLYRLFGVNAELLIDHAWGWEPCTIADIRAYRPDSRSLSSGQVLSRPYSWEEARVIVKEMSQNLALELVRKGLKTREAELSIHYDRESLADPAVAAAYGGALAADYYGRQVPKGTHGLRHLDTPSSSIRELTAAMLEIYDRTADPLLLVRRVTVTAKCLAGETEAEAQQLSLFDPPEAQHAREAALEREHRREKAMVAIREKFGNNAILTGTNLEKGATARERNRQIGGHSA